MHLFTKLPLASRVRPAGPSTWVIGRTFGLLCDAGRWGRTRDSRVRTVHVATAHFLEETPFNGRDVAFLASLFQFAKKTCPRRFARYGTLSREEPR